MIEHVTTFDPTLVAPIQQLLDQLTKQPINFGAEQLQALVESENSHLFVLREQEQIVGMLTIGSYLSPTGAKAWVEDVDVDKEHRGKEYGRELINHAIRFCEERLAPCSIMLTSNPMRVAANALYRSSGFEPKHTNVYKYNCL